MYSVSEEYLTKMLDQIQTHKLSGTVDGVSFDERDVIGVSVSNRCAEKKVSLGSVNIGTLKLTFLTDILNRGEYYGKTITLSDSLLLGLDENEEEIWETVPVGTFYIASATWTAAGIDITAYDVLSKLDKPMTVTGTSSKIYGFCYYIASETGTNFGMTSEECDALPNGEEVIALYEDANLETFRDLLSALAQMVGGFAYAARDGSWRLRSFDDVSVVTIPKNRRVSGSSFSDYETYYDTICYTDVQQKVVRYAGEERGQVINVGAQPFLQLGTGEAKERRAAVIANSIKAMTYTPFHSSMLPAFIALDLGDVITMTDDFSGNSSLGAVMEFTWTYNKTFSVNCYGDNPQLQTAQSKTDKNIAGIINETTQNEVTYYNFTNLDEINIEPEVETTIASLAFTAAQTTTVKIMHEFLMDMLKDLTVNGSYEIHYYLDNELVTYKPRETLSAVVGTVEVPIVPQPAEEPYTEDKTVSIDPVNISITRDFFYVIRNVAPNQRHTWDVKIITHGIEETVIGIQNAHITIEGQRLYGEGRFDGNIEIRENITLIPIGGLALVSITETAPVFDIQNAIIESAADNMTLIPLSGLDVMDMTEAINILMTYLALCTELEDDYYTEDGLDKITVQY